ncbi:ABC transporter permease [Reyranella sp. MMS21-HV4-11]|jgi:ABC-type spermidine/putrescine transport system permease subunit I|uniref:ABC transporter permease n=1 Tax=Reyranella humidisoli TaxID=2849149 RepID=A0ABS6IPA7_9HYPH|nr:ABC transporter permease [Reyranella sp. MMS21-HV4-11]MBU8876436.1 ABC transporter permease [Reyranella sp. MMS21-HV4-11]
MNKANRLEGFGFIAPLLVLMVVAFNAPIVYMLGLAFWEKGRGFTLEHYEGLLEAPVYLRVLGNTMRIALIATLANIIIGYPLAHWMRGLGARGRMIAIALVVLPFWVSILVRTYAWIVVLGNGGIVNRALQWSGLTDSPVSFLYNELGVTIGMANVLLPFLVLPLFAAMLRIDDRLLQAAASLGAPPRTIFWKVYFPLTLPALAAGALLVFILCLGFYVTPAILGGGRVPMISNLLDTLINQIPRWEQASAISTILLIVTLAIFAAYRRLDRKASA